MNKIRPFSLSELIITVGIISLLLVFNSPANNLAAGSVTDNSVSFSEFQTNVTTLSFGSVLLGQSMNKTIQLSNNESEALEITSIQLNPSYDVFSWEDSPIIIGGEETYNLVITFTPEAEFLYSSSLTIETNDSSSVSITLSGFGVSFPMIYLVEFTDGALNQSVVNGTIIINVWANDTTAVSSVSLTIGSEVLLFERSVGDLFTYEWKTKDYENGQYTLTITVEDILDYSSSIVYTFTVENEPGKSTFEKLQNPVIIGIFSVIVIALLIGVVSWFKGTFQRSRDYVEPPKI
ncbi:MAG: Ig-like domain-containing protein [Candidatus Kariarchaeaceae archaeon]